MQAQAPQRSAHESQQVHATQAVADVRDDTLTCSPALGAVEVPAPVL